MPYKGRPVKSSSRVPEGCEFCVYLKAFKYKGTRFRCNRNRYLEEVPNNDNCKYYKSKNE